MKFDEAIELPELTGAQLKEFRLEFGLTQAEAAQLLKISLSTFKRLESKNLIVDLIILLACLWVFSEIKEKGKSAMLEEAEQNTIYPTDEDLRKQRAELGLTQAQLARKLGVAFATVNRLENGHVHEATMLLYSIAVEELGKRMKEQEQERKTA